MVIDEILERDNPWWQDNSIPRVFKEMTKRPYCYQVLVEAHRVFQRQKVLLMEGPRQVGKTKIFYHIIDELLQLGTPPKAICYIDRQDADLQRYHETHSLRSTVTHYLQQIAPTQLRMPSSLPLAPLVLLDEIQYAPHWSDELKKFADDPQFRGKIIATGSALRLSRGLRESGAGRWPHLYIPHFGFYEYIHVLTPHTERNIALLGAKPSWDWTSPDTTQFKKIQEAIPFSIVQEVFNDFLARGGYPQWGAQEENVVAQKFE